MIRFLLVVAVLAISVLLYRLLDRRIMEFGQRRDVAARRIQTVRKILNILLAIAALLSVSFVLGLGYHQIAIFLSSVLAVIGVAFFAQWSILSHVTAGLIIFFAFPYRVGDRIKVVDPDEDVVGEIIEIATFHVLIRRADRSTVTYPNSALLQRAVIKLPASTDRLEVAPTASDADNGQARA